MYFNFVDKIIHSKLTSRIICWLLHWIRILLLFNCTPNSSIKRNIYKDFLTAYDNINNSVSVVNVVTMFYITIGFPQN